MKIAFFHHTLKLGSGIDTVVYELANRLAKKNVEVTVFCLMTSYNQNQCDFNLRLVRSDLASSTARQMILAPFLLNRVSNLKAELDKFDIVNTHHYPANYIVKGLKYAVNVVTEWSGARSSMFSSLKEKAYIKWVSHANRSAVQHADSVLAPCEFVKRWIKETYKTDAVTMYLDGVNFQLFDKKSVSSSSIYELHPFLGGKKIILFVGRMTESKNIHLLIDMFLIVKKKYPNVVLLLVGDYFSYPRYYKYLKDKIQTYNLSNDIIFTGIASWEDIPKYFSCCDIYVSCSSWEGFLRAEAFALSKPIVCFDTGANSETVVDSYSGYLVKHLDVYEFSSKVLALLEDESLATKFGKNGYDWAKRALDFDVIANNLLDYCKDTDKANEKKSLRQTFPEV